MRFVFESIAAKDMPDKIELEIRDKTGKVVYQRKQNIYYIKVCLSGLRVSEYDIWEIFDDFILYESKFFFPKMHGMTVVKELL